MVAASDNLAILASLSALAPKRVRKGETPTQTTMQRPEPGDAIAASPYADRNGLVVGTSDAGRLLHYTSDPHGKPLATYHSSSLNKPISTPQAAIARLEEGDDVDESRHPDLKIVPLKIGDTKHLGRSIIFHGGVAQGTVEPAKVGKQQIVTVSSAAMGPDRHFTERSNAIDAIHNHFVPDELEKDTDKMMTVSDILKAEDSSGHEHDAKTGQFTSKSGASYAVKYDHNSKGLALHNGEGKVLGTIKGTAKATKDGTIVQHHGHLHVGGTVGGPKTGTGADEMHAGRMATGRKMAEAHEKFQAQKARFQAQQGAAKSMTVGDIFKRGAKTVGELLKGDILAVPATMGAGNYVGSFEETLRRIRGPVCMGSGCDHKPKYDEAGNRIYEDQPETADGARRYPHYLDVVATFPEHAYVRCSDEDKTWKVPYTMDAEKVTVEGEPELVVAQFVPADEARGEAVDADEDDDAA